MTDQRQDRQMQEALDASLQPDAYRDLMEQVKRDPEASARYGQLQNVDAVMRNDRPKAAPSSLLDGIMGRIAQPETLPAPQPLSSGRALAVGLGIGTVVFVPLLLFASIGVLTVFGTGTALSSAALWVVGLVVFLYGAMSGTVGLVTANPLIIALVLLIPIAWAGLWYLGRGERARE